MTMCKSIIATFLVIAPLSGAAAESTVGVPAYRPTVDASIEFPVPERAARKAAAFVPAGNILMVTPGTQKSHIYTLLGAPHFHEGFNVRRWNYILNLYTGNGDEFLPCQYQIHFGRGGRVQQTYFIRPECAELLDRSATPDAAARTEPHPT